MINIWYLHFWSKKTKSIHNFKIWLNFAKLFLKQTNILVALNDDMTKMVILKKLIFMFNDSKKVDQKSSVSLKIFNSTKKVNFLWRSQVKGPVAAAKTGSIPSLHPTGSAPTAFPFSLVAPQTTVPTTNSAGTPLKPKHSLKVYSILPMG